MHASALLLYSVYDGSVLYTRTLPYQPSGPGGSCSMQWIPLEATRVPSQALAMLAALAPLPPVEDVQAQPAHVRPIPGARHAVPAAPKPSAGIAQGDGVLAQLPALANAADDAETAQTSLLYVLDDTGALSVFLDGTVCLGTCAVLADAVLVHAAPHRAAVLGTSLAQVSLPLHGERLLAVHHLAQLSTALQHELAHAADAVHCASQAWRTLARPRAAEWHTHLEDLAKRYAVDIGLELMTLVMTGRTAPASEQLLLHNLTEGVRFSTDTGDDCHGARRTPRSQTHSTVRWHDACAGM